MFKKKQDQNLEEKEEEIMNYYTEDEIEEEEEEQGEEYEEFREEGVLSKETKIRRIRFISNIVFIVIIIILSMIAIDVICVARYEKGPFFAIPLKTYKDGGSKAYYGIGYKVIKYNQTQGRRDKEIGTWSLKYNTNPITIQDIDLAIEMRGNEISTYKKYYRKFVRIISTLKKVDKKNHTITIGYEDEEGKYSLDIVCEIVKEQEINQFEVGKEITIIGTINNYKEKTKKANNRLYAENCFAEQ